MLNTLNKFFLDTFSITKLFYNVRQENSTHTHYIFHMVAPSIWPIYVSMCSGWFLMKLVYFMHFGTDSMMKFDAFILLLLGILGWFYDIIVEGTYHTYHNKKVQLGFRMGVLLFIFSEVMLFFAFFGRFLQLV